MIALKKSADENCRQLLAAYFTKFPNDLLQTETSLVLKRLSSRQIPMLGKPGGWADGIIYVVANQNRRACGIPGLLNRESVELFNVSMETIYRRAWQIRRLLAL